MTTLRDQIADALTTRINATMLVDPARHPGLIGQPFAATPDDLADAIWPVIGPVLAEKDDEIERLRARVAELEPFEPQLQHMELGPGGFTMTVTEAKNASAGFVAAAKAMLDAYDAPNYVEQEIFLGETRERYVIVYGRPGGKLPSQLRREAEGALADVLRIVSNWCVEANDVGGVDAGDLAWALEQAGHPLPGEKDQ